MNDILDRNEKLSLSKSCDMTSHHCRCDVHWFPEPEGH